MNAKINNLKILLTRINLMYILNNMATLQKKKIYNNWYWYIVESKRIKGKPRPIVIMYIGTTEKLIKMLMEKANFGKVRVKSYSYGTVYGLLKVAEEIGLLKIFEKYFPNQRRDNLSVGESLLLCSIYRACKVGSKRAFSDWVCKTSLPFLLEFNPRQLSSQHFWDQMETVKEEDIEKVEEEIVKTLIKRYGISMDVLLYDVTNFYTYISTNNRRNNICKRGRNKQRRNDLRQFNLAILVSREFFVPILSQIYEGNKTDVGSFPTILSKIRKRLESISQKVEDITLVFDKGNYSKKIQKELEEAKVGWVGCLSTSLSDDFTKISKKDFYSVRLTGDKEVLAYRANKNLWGKEVVIVITFSEKLKRGQIKGLNDNLAKAINYLKEIDGSRGSVKKAKADMEKIVSKEYTKEVLNVKIIKRRGVIKAEWEIKTESYEYLLNEYFGRKVLFTTRGNWGDKEIISAYYGLGKVENVFKRLKNPFHLSVIPQFHWTDQKIKVHTFCCLVGLILIGLLHRRIKEKGIDISVEKLLDKLENIRESLIIENTGSRGKPRVKRQIEEMDEETKALLTAINN